LVRVSSVAALGQGIRHKGIWLLRLANITRIMHWIWANPDFWCIANLSLDGSLDTVAGWLPHHVPNGAGPCRPPKTRPSPPGCRSGIGHAIIEDAPAGRARGGFVKREIPEQDTPRARSAHAIPEAGRTDLRGAMHVLIDYESVQPDDLGALGARDARVTVFVGANQTRLPFELVAAMQALGERGRYVKIGGIGRNALDFHLAFYLGELAACDPHTHYRIVSKDTGFDPVISHLRGRGLCVERVPEVLGASPGIPGAASEPATPAD
jgi:hypothetical protein